MINIAFLVRDARGRNERAVAEDEGNGHFRAADVEAEDREWFCHVLGLLPEKCEKNQKTDTIYIEKSVLAK